MTKPRSDFNEMQDSQPSASKTAKSIGVHASINENSDSENDDFPLRASKMKDLKHPAKPLFRSVFDVDLSQAAACDGTLITTSAENQEIVPGTLPTF